MYKSRSPIRGLRAALEIDLNSRPCPVKCEAYLTGVRNSDQNLSGSGCSVRDYETLLWSAFKPPLQGVVVDLPISYPIKGFLSILEAKKLCPDKENAIDSIIFFRHT